MSNESLTTALVILVLQIPFVLQFLIYGAERAGGKDCPGLARPRKSPLVLA